MTTLTMIAAAVAAAIAAVFGAYFKGARAGRDRVRADHLEKQADVQAKFDQVDSERPDLDGAVDRLRKRSQSDSKPPSSWSSTVGS